jgi:integrase
MPRQPNGHPKIYKGADGKYHCYVTVGWDEVRNLPRRRHVERAKSSQVKEAVDEILKQLAAGGQPQAGRAETVADWLRYYLEYIVKEELEYKTWRAYQPIVELHLIPRIGRYRLAGTRDVLQPHHVEAAYTDLKKSGMAASYVRQCHVVLSRALKIAEKRGIAARNVCKLIDGPSVRKRKPKPLPVDVVHRIIATIRGRDDELRWLLAMLGALRQGETLGLRWDRLVRDGKSGEPLGIWTFKQVQRRSWRHGCKDPVECVKAKAKCRTKSCRSWDHGCGPLPELYKPGTCGKSVARACPERVAAKCRDHKGESCPPLCVPNCTAHARVCPKRKEGGLVEKELKSEGSERYLPFDPYVARLVKVRRAEAKLRAGEAWTGDGLLFTARSGGAVDPRRDHEAWKQLLVDAGVPDAELHAARHTAATILVDSGAELSTVQELLGHSDIRVTRGYVEVGAELKKAATAAVGARFLGLAE